MTPATAKSPTALVSYSHTDPGWTRERQQTRLEQVKSLVFALRENGIDVDADFFHTNQDWTRWGPDQVESSDFVLVIASPAWKQAWSGVGNPAEYRGLRAEASALRSIEYLGANMLQQRCRVLMLPGSTDADIPTGMHGLARHQIAGFSAHELEPLLRDLTSQPSFQKPALGRVPIFPPAMTTMTPDVARPLDEDSANRAAIHEQRAGRPAVVIDSGERVRQLRAQLDTLPQPLPGEGPHLPWYRARQQIEGLLYEELQAQQAHPAAETDSTAESPTDKPRTDDDTAAAKSGTSTRPPATTSGSSASSRAHSRGMPAAHQPERAFGIPSFIKRHWRRLVAGLVTLIVIPLLLEWTGLTDLRLTKPDPSPTDSSPAPSTPGTSTPSSSGPSSRLPLTPDSPVRVTWEGQGDRVTIEWDEMSFPRLHHYSVDVVGMAPVEVQYNVGYRFGQELRTSVPANPIAEGNEQLATLGKTARVDHDETWKVCVQAMRKVPGGAYVDPYIIDGGLICSDPFNIPE